MVNVVMFSKLAAQVLAVVLTMTSPWEVAMESAYVATGLDEAVYPRLALVALIEVESCGRTHINKGKYVGPLQLGPHYLADAGVSAARAQTRSGALLAWAKIQARYQVRRAGDSELAIPIMHKGGPGTLKRWREHVIKKRRSLTWKEQVDIAEHAARITGVRGMSAFLERYTAARMGEGWWCGPKNELPSREALGPQEKL